MARNSNEEAMTSCSTPTNTDKERKPKIPVIGVNRIIAVGSGKGGVGKSTVAVNLAVALASLGLKVGLVDADIYGPSVARMLGVTGEPVIEGNRMRPLEAYGVKIMSMAFLFVEETAAIWRGPMTSKALFQLIRQTSWGVLDLLLIDMPPGTGDVQLSLMEQYPLEGIVMVSTPQAVALADVKRAVTMCHKLDIPVLAMVENMHHFTDEAGKQHHLFGKGEVKSYAKQMQIPYAGGLPIDPQVAALCDAGGTPPVLDPASLFGASLMQLARTLSK
jgi:ATP-binding protein involved in chromosome partitioning